MSELLQAAKTVINAEFVSQQRAAIENLRAAVERAEKQEAVGFDEWWKENGIEWDWTLTEIDAERFWTAAQQAERERIRARAKIAAEKVWRAGDWYIGPQHFMLEQFVDALVDVLEDGDE